MQAAVNRSSAAPRQRRTDKTGAKPHLVTADDTGLLDALPIAAAVIVRDTARALKVTAHNGRFVDAVRQSSCTALNWNDAECLKAGPISDQLHAFFDGTEASGELDFKDGEGVTSHYFRMKLAPLPRGEAEQPRCLLSVVDR